MLADCIRYIADMILLTFQYWVRCRAHACLVFFFMFMDMSWHKNVKLKMLFAAISQIKRVYLFKSQVFVITFTSMTWYKTTKVIKNYMRDYKKRNDRHRKYMKRSK